MWSPKTEADLSWFFCYAIGAYRQSSTGLTLDTARRLCEDSDGCRVKSLNQREDEIFTQRKQAVRDGEPLPEGITAQQIHKSTRETIHVVPNDAYLRRFARISRMLCCISPRAYRVLAEYYGESGGFWQNQPVGRIFAVYKLTTIGSKMGSKRSPHVDTADQSIYSYWVIAKITGALRTDLKWKILDQRARELVVASVAEYHRAVG